MGGAGAKLKNESAPSLLLICILANGLSGNDLIDVYT